MTTRARRIAIMLDLQWPYKRHSAIFAGTQQYAEEQGWHCIVDEFVHDSITARHSKTPLYDGVIARANQALQRISSRRKLPVVNVWASSPVHSRLPGAFPDYHSVGRVCAEHLLTRGFHSFATLTAPKTRWQELVLDAFIGIVGEAGFPCEQGRIPQNPWRDLASWRRTEQMVQKCVDGWTPPIGVYASHEGVGRLIVQACHRRGLRVPADVAVIAGQNEETLCEHPRPSLTSVEMGFERIGYEAARLLHDLMDGKKAPKQPIVLPPQGLVIRESTDFISVDNDLVSAALAFISANSHREIGQDDVSKAVGAETRTLQNRFRKHLGRPIVTEIRRVRIERAKRELVQSKRSMAEIARDVGFGHPMRMYEVFRRELGVTPSEYRKQRQLEVGGM